VDKIEEERAKNQEYRIRNVIPPSQIDEGASPDQFLLQGIEKNRKIYTALFEQCI
jgi:hypothetical protein